MPPVSNKVGECMMKVNMSSMDGSDGVACHF